MHSHGHHHHHGHNHGHHHTGQDSSDRRIGIAFFLNLIFAVIEFVGGWLTNSTAIMADAVHDLGDSLSIGSAWLLNRMGKRSADDEFTYGYQRLSLFGALLNGVVLVAGSIWVLSEALPRLMDPVMPVTEGMLALAVLGVAVNGYAAYRLSAGTTLNERVLNWHLMEDVFGWVAVLVVALVMQFVDWPILDPLLSIVFTLFILLNVARLLWSTGKLFFQAVPDAALLTRVRETLVATAGVDSAHHLHLWSLDGEHHVLTAHLVLADSVSVAAQLQLKALLAERLAQFNLAYTTLEFEFADEACRDQAGKT
ncbi:cation diffusion facilitator family transporter [Ketobacter sp.]|uniref:cation diffusion facilitator family transporter n=1 Tax=Ketobacter sp. TaxID=2083498 RepID=UPI000F1069D5|nr:cation diffusion facilitator family transporter [Ketobacter sp.]RLU01331.1 MAG: cation transporter [Ketobacter sp.]